MPPPVVASVVAVGLRSVAIYASRVFVAPADLTNLFFFLFHSHVLTYVPNVFLPFGLITFLSFCTISVLANSGLRLWAIGLVEPLCGCTEFA